MVVSLRQVRIPVLGNAGPRSIVIDDSGDLLADDIFLCLPGILETSKVFATLPSLLGKDRRIVAINFAGRAESDRLPTQSDYKMGVCVADIVATIAWLRGSLHTPAGKFSLLGSSGGRRASARIHLIGNSMGGLLGAYIASRIPGYVHSLILNDVGSLLPWSGLVQLFGAIGRASLTGVQGAGAHSIGELARVLDVDPRLISAVMNPSHLDLSHTSGMQGISFEDHFAAVEAPILLMHSASSALVTPSVVGRMQDICRQLQVVALPGDRHPLPFDTKSATLIDQFIASLPWSSLGENADGRKRAAVAV